MAKKNRYSLLLNSDFADKQSSLGKEMVKMNHSTEICNVELHSWRSLLPYSNTHTQAHIHTHAHTHGCDREQDVCLRHMSRLFCICVTQNRRDVRRELITFPISILLV